MDTNVQLLSCDEDAQYRVYRPTEDTCLAFSALLSCHIFLQQTGLHMRQEDPIFISPKTPVVFTVPFLEYLYSAAYKLMF